MLPPPVLGSVYSGISGYCTLLLYWRIRTFILTLINHSSILYYIFIIYMKTIEYNMRVSSIWYTKYTNTLGSMHLVFCTFLCYVCTSTVATALLCMQLHIIYCVGLWALKSVIQVRSGSSTYST